MHCSSFWLVEGQSDRRMAGALVFPHRCRCALPEEEARVVPGGDPSTRPSDGLAQGDRVLGIGGSESSAFCSAS